MDGSHLLVICLISEKHTGVGIIEKKKWVGILADLEKMDPTEELDFGEETLGTTITVSKFLKLVKIYDSPDHIRAYKLLFQENKYVGLDIISQLKETIAVIKGEFI